MAKLVYKGTRLVLELTPEEKQREKAKKEKANPTNKEIMESLQLVMQVLGVEVEE